MIATERLILRQWRDSDREPFAAMGADPEVMAHFPALLTSAESDAIVDRLSTDIAARGWGLWAIECRDDGRFLGFTGLNPVTFPCPVEGDVEIGWRLARAAWGQGYAREAASAALAFGWQLGLPRIVSFTVPANVRSWGLMQRIGLDRRDDLDFDHPRLPADHPLRRHIVYAADRA
ncbi:GCN5 family acetyltransferase [alpha proteobacterium AAP81b]|nr:GCN5 family acetyltransferase [alpha proteobacterium AAP81b]